MENYKLFDLNIKNILPNWDIVDALRELISNAYDESILTNTEQKPLIKYDKNQKSVSIRDFGRGIRIEHFTLNENEEKSKNKKMIGKFGIGLKDAIAVLFKNNKKIILESVHGTFIPVISQKSLDYSDIETIHIEQKNFSEVSSGTLITVYDVEKEHYENVLKLFLNSASDSSRNLLLSNTCGEIYTNINESKIYYNGMQISKNDDFVFSYNILDVNATFVSQLNRERKSISRNAYSSLIIKILKEALTDKNQDLLNQIYESRHYSHHTEWSYKEVKQIFFQCTNRKILICSENIKPSYKEYAKDENYEICVLNKKDYDSLKNVGVSTLNDFGINYISNYDAKKVVESSLDFKQKDNWDEAKQFLRHFAQEWQEFKKIESKITFELIESHPNAIGIANSKTFNIQIVKSIVKDQKLLLSTMLHEICHLISQEGDATIKFENALTDCIGNLAKYSQR